MKTCTQISDSGFRRKINVVSPGDSAKALFRLGARARCSGTGTILSTSLNAVLKANTIKTVPSTGTTSIGSGTTSIGSARHYFDCVRFGHCEPARVGGLAFPM